MRGYERPEIVETLDYIDGLDAVTMLDDAETEARRAWWCQDCGALNAYCTCA